MTACSSAAAAWCSPRWSSISPAESTAAMGLALPVPAMSGAEPCTGSNSEGPVRPEPPAPPRFTGGLTLGSAWPRVAVVGASLLSPPDPPPGLRLAHAGLVSHLSGGAHPQVAGVGQHVGLVDHGEPPVPLRRHGGREAHAALDA